MARSLQSKRHGLLAKRDTPLSGLRAPVLMMKPPTSSLPGEGKHMRLGQDRRRDERVDRVWRAVTRDEAFCTFLQRRLGDREPRRRTEEGRSRLKRLMPDRPKPCRLCQLQARAGGKAKSERRRTEREGELGHLAPRELTSCLDRAKGSNEGHLELTGWANAATEVKGAKQGETVC